ncbi:Flagellar hook protein FlgE [Liberibacter crescens BT-1]|uniref:Flagellar hook protein FlgE n=1 Tax=Liberibacter crescens (strain BT-1) TaxID=1215343 RepID=L0EWA4_LIBCB|nr:flagellar hook protein FlgE [Liberibacter crescens]AGA64938.1 Flagellar hook protein FlgE [Liberibacter crescens BT-1]AMC12959.1 flagellar hook protein FlgE [Liberibacter crescens]
MSIFGTMKTAVSGMNAQTNRVTAVGDNIANVNTVGYKRTSASFSSFVVPSTGSYSSGGVETNMNYFISEQGTLIHTVSNTDLAIDGEGFFIVKDSMQVPHLTRSGSFKVNHEGYLQNSAGYILMAYPYNEQSSSTVINSFAGLHKVNVKSLEMKAEPTTYAFIPANLDKDAHSVAGDSPKDNKALTQYTHKTSFSAYDSLGSNVIYDLYYTKNDNGKWEVTVFRQDQATQKGFPYQNQGVDVSPLASEILSFDLSNGRLKPLSKNKISFIDNTFGVPQKIEIDLSKTTQLAGGFIPQKTEVNGQAPSMIENISVNKQGVVSVVYGDGAQSPIYRLALASVPSINNLQSCTGNVYLPTHNSGKISIGFAGNGRCGEIISNALESSNVDIAHELTEVIEAQRNYVANSKVFQTGSEILDVLINLKR